MFFGLNLRQLICSILAAGVAVAIYFFLRGPLGTETVSWLCILGAVPFAAVGFIKYNGMTLERFLFAWFKSEILMPRHLEFKAENAYYHAASGLFNRKQERGRKKEEPYD